MKYDPSALAQTLDAPRDTRYLDQAQITMQQPVLTTKLHIPAPPRVVVTRDRLYRLLDLGSRRPLTAVVAPPGYGKTTLVSGWAQSTGRQVVWLTASAEIQHPTRFASYLRAAFLAANLSFQISGTDEPDTIEYHEWLRYVLSLLDHLTEPITLVIDNFQLITSPDVLEQILLLIANLPDTAHIVLLSSAPLAIQFSRMRLHDELAEVTATDLTFSRAESDEFLHKFGVRNLSEDQLGWIYERSHGWIAGIQLAALLINTNRDETLRRSEIQLHGYARLINDYLAQEVVQGLSTDLRSFLLRTSMLRQFNADVCDAALSTSKSAQLIAEALRQLLFITTHQEMGKWFSYHSLFAGALEQLAGEEIPEQELRAINRRAAGWFRDRNYLDDAAYHGLQSGDWEFAIPIVAELCHRLISRGEIHRVLYWLEQIPQEELRNHGQLATWLPWALNAAGRPLDALTVLDEFQTYWQDDVEQDVLAHAGYVRASIAFRLQDEAEFLRGTYDAISLIPESNPEQRLLAWVARHSALVLQGNTNDAGAAYLETRRYLNRVRYSEPSWEVTVESAQILRMSLEGPTGEAITYSRHLLEWLDGGTANSSVGIKCCLADMLIAQNELDQATTLVEELAELPERVLNPARVLVLRATISWARGDRGSALEMIGRALHVSLKTGNQQAISLSRSLQAWYWIESNELVLARRWAAQEKDTPVSWLRHFHEHHVGLSRIRLALAEGDTRAALGETLDLISETVRRRRFTELPILHLLAARALEQSERRESALIELERAIRIGGESWLVRSFLDHGASLVPNLRHRWFSRINPAFVREVETRFHAIHKSATRAISITERERQILETVNQGLSNSEIGSVLGISEATVKRHLYNIFQKLSAANRVEAISRARGLNLI